jgi:hypothetical protein
MMSLLNGALEFCDAFLQRCRPYGLPIYTFNNSRQTVCSFFKPAFDFASM